ncbi:MAG TPA: hypothetical protein ENK27_13980 [Desulfobulbus sp.]|nr:hypothetical protein [Desulfobulbus sp.]
MRDAYLLPVTIFFLLVTLATFAYRARSRNGYGPLAIGLAASVSIVVGKFSLALDPLVYGGAGILVLASIWNALPVRRGERELPGPPDGIGRE